jgi:hypothetical protein
MAGTLDFMVVDLALGQRGLRMTATVTNGEQLPVDQKHCDPVLSEIDFETDSF